MDRLRDASHEDIQRMVDGRPDIGRPQHDHEWAYSYMPRAKARSDLPTLMATRRCRHCRRNEALVPVAGHLAEWQHDPSFLDGPP